MIQHVLEKIKNREKMIPTERRIYFNALIVALLVFIGRFLWIVRYTKFSISNDRMGDLAVPTYLAGLDWKYLIGQVGYYGYGFKFLFCVFFKFTDNPVVIHRLISFLYALLFSLCGFFFYKVFSKYWEKKHDFIMITGIVSALVIFEGDVLGSEYSLVLATFVLAFLIERLITVSTVAQKRIYSAITAVFLCYTITLHERSLALVLAFGIAVVIDVIYTKKLLIALETFVPAYLVAWGIEEYVTSTVQAFFWGNVEGEIKNASVSMKSPLWFLDSFTAFKELLKCGVSNGYTFIIHSYGIFLIAFIISLVFAIDFFRKREAKKYYDVYIKNRSLIIVLMISFFAAMIMLVGISVRWSKTVYAQNANGYRGYTYFRYYFTWAIISLPISIYIYEILKDRVSWVMKLIITLGYIPLAGWFCLRMFPVISYMQVLASKNIYVNRAYLAYDFWKSEPSKCIGTAVLCGIFLLVWIWGRERSVKVGSVVLLLLVFLIIDNGKINLNLGISSYADPFCEIMQKAEAREELPQDIYIYSTKNRAEWTLQFVLPKYRIINKLPDPVQSDVLLITTDYDRFIDTLLVNRGYTRYQLDNSLYLWIKGTELRESLESYIIEYWRKNGPVAGRK